MAVRRERGKKSPPGKDATTHPTATSQFLPISPSTYYHAITTFPSLQSLIAWHHPVHLITSFICYYCISRGGPVIVVKRRVKKRDRKEKTSRESPNLKDGEPFSQCGGTFGRMGLSSRTSRGVLPSDWEVVGIEEGDIV